MTEARLVKSKGANMFGAAAFSLLMAGLGQISCGRIKRGIVLYGASLLIAPIAFFLVTRITPPYNIVIPAILTVGFMLFVIIDALRIASNPENTLRMKPLPGYLLLAGFWLANSLLVTPLLASTIKQDMIQAYRIPSGAMMPTLLTGDQILTDKHIYQTSEPQRGDIVVFPYPLKPEQDFIKRVVAVGGDTVEIRAKKLYVNGEEVPEPYVIHKDPETIPAGRTPRDFFGPVSVPEDSVFTLGDNRDNSHDSRFWGFVRKDAIKAKAITLYWSWDRETGKVRWDRIGQPIS